MAKQKSKTTLENYDDFEEEDYDYSENSKSKDSNIFSKAYNFLEQKYFSFSEWLSNKGIPLNKLNNFLEEKGIPSFAFVLCFLLLLIVISTLIIVNVATTANIDLQIKDYSGNSISDAQLIITDLYGKTKFSGIVSDGDKIKAKLKSGTDYMFLFSKEGLNDIELQKVFVRGEQVIARFNEKYDSGDFSLVVIDSQTSKRVPGYEAKLEYRLNGKLESPSVISDEKGELIFTSIPLEKDLSLTINADGYQTYTLNFKLSNYSESKTISLEFDQDSINFLGAQSKATIVVTNENGDLLDQADVTIYNLEGEILETGVTVLGKALFTLDKGLAIRFVVTKEGYRTYDSDNEERSFRLQNEEETFTAKLKAGSSDLKVLVSEHGVGPLQDVVISLYNENNNLIESKTTQMDGVIVFTGLENETDYLVTACKTGYYCVQNFANVELINELDIKLEKTSLNTSYLLSVYVYDNNNNPVANAKVTFLKEVSERFVATGHGPQSVDLTGQATILTKEGEKYKVTATVGESFKTEEITIDPFVDNKVILVLDDASRFLTLALLDKDGNPIEEGCVFITSKTGEILFDDCLYGSNIVEFNNQGYKDLIVEYTDLEGNTTTVSTRVGESDDITLTIKPSVVGNTPIISFLELRDFSNNPTTLLSINDDYYAVFDVLIPEGYSSCGVHFRAGEDSKSDSDNMLYGITGYKADTVDYKYSTTYNFGQQSIDYDNSGQPNQMNKWLELYWRGQEQVTNKQIMVKLKATDISEKFVLKYRVWCEAEGKVYRDPVDSILNDTRANAQRQFLYADTKEQVFEILEKPVSCSGDLCIDYKFIDAEAFEYTPEDFFAVNGEVYALEFNMLSLKNTEISIDVETEKSRPIIGLLNFQATNFFPSNEVDSVDLQLSESYISLQANQKNQIYLFFKAKDIGVTYLDLKINNNSQIIEKRISFNSVSKKTLDVSVLDVIPYNSPIVVEIKDNLTKKPIDNAFVKVDDGFGNVLGSVKNSRTGKYIINQNFTMAKPTLKITVPGYVPYTKQLNIADTGMILGPNKLEIYFGENISQEVEKFTITNKGNLEITDLRFEMRFYDYVSSLYSSLDLPYSLKPNKGEEVELISTVDSSLNFKTAKGVLTISGFIGNKQVIKEIEVIFYRGLVKNDCLEITPKQLYAYVGISDQSTQELTFNIKNNCNRAFSITPQLLNAKGTTIRKDENIEIIIPNIDIDVGEEIEDYVLIVKNNKERKLTKTYNFEIAWRNQYYVFENTKLSVELIDLTKSLVVIPATSAVSLMQIEDVAPAANRTVFLLRNTGKYTLTDVQISRFEPKIVSNIEDQIEPNSFESIKPGETKQVVIRYSGKIDKATYADLLYQVTSNAPGVSEPITSRFTVGFMFSSAGCLKLDQSRLSFYSKVGEEKTKLINITNQCAEPIGLITHDKGVASYFIDTFGDGTQVSIYPATPNPVIQPGQTAGYYFKIKATKHFPPKTDSVLRLLGSPINYGQGGRVSSSTLLFSIELEPEHPEQEEDYKRVEENVSIPVCGEEDSLVSLTFPVVVPDCKQDGYCDGASAAVLILEKIQSLHTEVIGVANQANNKVIQTACSQTAANNGYCPISDILPPQKLEEYKNILLYLQNDTINERTLKLVLDSHKEKDSKFPTIKNYMLKTNVGQTTGGLAISGNIIHMTDKIKGCGRYKLELSGYVATRNYTDLDTQRAYFFVDVVDSNVTDQCKKTIENINIFLPKNLDFIRTNTGDTWLTILTGNQSFAGSIAKDVYGSQDRFVLRSPEQKKYSLLDISIGEITENENAIAKMYFKDLSQANGKKAEEINIIINNKFGIKKEGFRDVNYPEEFIKETSNNIRNILDGKSTDVCISKDKSYLLIMGIDKDFGTLFLKAKDSEMLLKPTKVCTTLTVKSAINEEVMISNEALSGTKVVFNLEGKDYDASSMPLLLEKDKEKDFNVCIFSDISQISNLSGKELKIIAESRFSEVGKINSKRKGEAVIKLKTYGLTPVELLSVVQRTTEELKNEDEKAKVIFAYVDWDNKYNSKNIEEYCKSLEKYNLKLGSSKSSKETVFKRPEICDFKETDTEKSAKNKRAIEKSGTYFGACLSSCAALQFGADFLWQLIPGVGQVKYGADFAWNCGLGCAIPTIDLYISESEVAKNVLETIGKIIDGVPILREVKWFMGKVGELISGGASEQAVSDGDIAATGLTVASANAIARTVPEDLLTVSGTGVPIIDTATTVVPDPIITSTPTGPPVTPSPGATTTGFSKKIQSNLTSQMNGRLEYIDRALLPSDKFLTGTGKTSLSNKINTANLSTNELDDLVRIAKKTTDGGKFSWNKFTALTDSEMDEFVKLLNKSGYTGINSGRILDVGPNGLGEKIDAYKTHRATTPSSTPTTTTPTTTPATSTTSTPTTTTTTTNTIADDLLETQIKANNKTLENLAKNKTNFEAQYNELAAKKGPFTLNKKSQLKALQDQIDEMDDITKAFTKRGAVLDDIAKTTPQNGVYNISDDAARELSKNTDDLLKTLKGPTSKWTKFGRTAGKIGVDMLVIYLSNKTANSALNVLSSTKGALAETIMVAGEVPITEFKKGVWYRVDLFVGQNNSYTQVYTIEEPNITTENIIYHNNGTETEKLITTDYLEELYQTNTPQNSPLDMDYLPFTEEDSRSNQEILEQSSSLTDYQTQMYIQNENKLEVYNDCTFSSGGTTCHDIDSLKPHDCSAFAQRVATSLYGITYERGNACDSASVNFGTKNKVVWQNGVNPLEDLDKHLVPGAIITINARSSTLPNCQPTHVILYVGKKNGYMHQIIHQYGSEVLLEPLFSAEGGKFTANPDEPRNQIYQVVIPRSGFPNYDKFN